MEEQESSMSVDEASNLLFGCSSGDLYHDSVTLCGRPSHITETECNGSYGSGTNANGTPTLGYRLGNVKPGDVLEIHVYKEMNDVVSKDYVVYVTVTD